MNMIIPLDMSEIVKRSKAWYVLPIVIGIFGGIISYFAVRKDDPKLGKNCLIVGIIMLVIDTVMGVTMILFSELMV